MSYGSVIVAGKEASRMTKTGENRKPKLPNLARGSWHVCAFGLVLICLARIYLWPEGNSWLVGGALSLCVLAGFLLDVRLGARKERRGAEKGQQLGDGGTAAVSETTAAPQSRLAFDLCAIAVPVLAVFGTQFARDYGWLGNNATDRTDAVVILGVVFIAAVGRLWWRHRQENHWPTQSRREAQ